MLELLRINIFLFLYVSAAMFWLFFISKVKTSCDATWQRGNNAYDEQVTGRFEWQQCIVRTGNCPI